MATRTISNIPTITGILLALFNFVLTITTMPIGTHGLSIRLVPIASLFPKNLTLEERHYKLVEISKNHALHLQQHSMIMRSTSSTVTNSTNSIGNLTKELAPNAILQLSIRRDPIGFYMGQVFIGSKLFPAYMMIDSGSDLSWVQCEGCQSCFPLNGAGNFKYTQSQSLRHLSCYHPLCIPRLCDQHGFCQYQTNYLTSSSKGMVLTDSFTFSTNGSPTTSTYPNLVFGCGLANVNIPFGVTGNVIAGVFGLGLGKNSFLVQLQHHTNRRFSYCLPSLDTPTSLYFGDDARIRAPSSMVQETSLVRGVERYYVLDVLGISIDGVLLQISRNVFRLRRDYTGGFAVDSGSPYSYIVQSAYNILKGKMVQYILEHNGLHPLQQPPSPFELCYNMPTTGRTNYVLPSMTFHFRGANLMLKPDVVFQSFRGNSIKCLAILRISEQGPTILGALQQTNHEFLFDGGRSTMAFAPQNCA